MKLTLDFFFLDFVQFKFKFEIPVFIYKIPLTLYNENIIIILHQNFGT